jgi:gliding motility-associated-like protein
MRVTFNCSSNSSFNFYVDLNKIAGTGQEITPGCSASPTRCSGSQYNNYGIQEYVYQGTVTLAPCNSWTISCSSCCRNSVTTVSGQGSWTMLATLNNLNAPCNSSPTFSNKPVAIVCNNQAFCYNHGALDPDGDSLVYSFYSPFTNYPSSVPYTGGYSSTIFLSSSTPITIDSITGDICFTPNAILSTVTGVKVQEYRTINGTPTLIGTVYRDLQMKVVQCNNQIPVISGMDTTLSHTYNPNDTTYRIDVCLSNDPIVFDINGFDADTFNPGNTGHPERFSISWNNGIPTGSFTTHYNGTDSAYAHFSWLPTAADVGNIKCFTATIQDEACPYNGFQTFSYCIMVRGMMVDIGSDTLLCEGENLTVQAVADTSTVNYLWYLNGSPTGTPQSQDWYYVNSTTLGPGKHILSIKTNDGSTTMACPGVDYITIEVVTLPDINGTLLDSAFCKGGSITYDAGPGQQYTWTDIALNPLGASQTFTTGNSGLYIVTVNGGINTRCYDVDTFEVVSIPNPKLGPDTCIWKADAPLKLDAGFIPSGLSYNWQDGSTGQTYNVNKSGKYSVTIHHNTISPSVGCSDEQVVNVIDQDNMILSAKIEASEDVELEDPQAGDRDICALQRLKMIAPNDYSYDYSWSNNNTVVSTSQFYIFKEKTAGDYIIELNVGGCVNDITVTTKICDIQVPNIITPNGDGANDRFRIVLKASKEDFFKSFPNSTLLIYNRWGKKIFESNNYQNTWDGEGAADGVYYWTLELEDGEETQMQGTVTIISK